MNVQFLFTVAGAILFVAGFIRLWQSIRDAKLGYEDEKGFHQGRTTRG